MIDIEKVVYLKAMGIDLWRRRQRQQDTGQCTACDLSKTRKNIVFGDGNLKAKIMIVGEAPGASEDEQGKPFVGRAGQLLTNMLRSIGINREEVYITNILKCRPPENRDPTADEIKKCMPFLKKEIEMVEPKIILTLGKIAAQTLLESDQPMGELRENIHEYGEQKISLFVIYHPAYLLRSPTQKAKAYDDLLRVKKIVEQYE